MPSLEWRGHSWRAWIPGWRCNSCLWRSNHRGAFVGSTGKLAFDILLPRGELADEIVQHVGNIVYAVLELHHTFILSKTKVLADKSQYRRLNILWWRNIFVLAFQVVFSAELARSRFVASLLARPTAVASLSSPN
jgi:hypothetical protein